MTFSESADRDDNLRGGICNGRQIIKLRISSIDKEVGAKLRERRKMLGMSQQQLAEMIGISYQQANKLESGLNRISAVRLFHLAQALAIPTDWFFEGLSSTLQTSLSLSQRRGYEFSRNFSMLGDQQQDALSQMARVLASQSDARQEGGEAGAATRPDLREASIADVVR